MNERKTAKTAGTVYLLGMIATLLLFISTVLQYPTIAITGSLAGLASGGMKMFVYLWPIISFLVYPGIFTILLHLGKDKPVRGNAFGIVWIVFSAIFTIWSLVVIAQYNDKSLSGYISQAVTPASLKMSEYFRLFGNIFIILSCAKHLHTIYRGQENQIKRICPNCGKQAANGAFCNACGYKIPNTVTINPGNWQCVNCNHINDSTNAFCTNCGSPKNPNC